VNNEDVKRLATQVKNSFPDILNEVKAILTDSTNQQAQQNLTQAVSRTKEILNNVLDAAQGKPREPIKPAEVDFKAFDTVTTGDEALAIAADAVSKTVAPYLKRAEEDQDDIVLLAKKISEDLRELGKGLKKADVVSLLKWSKETETDVKHLYTLAIQLSKQVTDKNMSNVISISATAVANRVVTLKVIVGVKANAASLAKDPAAEHQLIGCTKELSIALIKVINGAEAAKIKAKVHKSAFIRGRSYSIKN